MLREAPFQITCTANVQSPVNVTLEKIYVMHINHKSFSGDGG